MLCPTTITPEILRLRDACSPGAEPIYLEVTPGPEYMPNLCHLNVDKQVGLHGGSKVYGWKVWQYQDYIEAEFHSVWRSPYKGRLVEITPDDSGETRILFFEDPVRAHTGWSAKHGRRVLALNKQAKRRLEGLNIQFMRMLGQPPMVFVSRE